MHARQRREAQDLAKDVLTGNSYCQVVLIYMVSFCFLRWAFQIEKNFSLERKSNPDPGLNFHNCLSCVKTVMVIHTEYFNRSTKYVLNIIIHIQSYL